MDLLTQTVEVRGFCSDDELNAAMQGKLESIYLEILSSEPVAQASAEYEAAQEAAQKLKGSQAWLSAQSRELFAATRELSREIERALIESRTAPPASLSKLDRVEAEHRAVSRANSRIIEHLLPQAEIVELRRAAAYYSAKAQAVRAAAAERIQKTAQMMAEAAEYEGGIVFDPVNTLSGEMQRQAGEFERQAANHTMWAGEREEKYLKLAKELQSIGR